MVSLEQIENQRVEEIDLQNKVVMFEKINGLYLILRKKIGYYVLRGEARAVVDIVKGGHVSKNFKYPCLKFFAT